MEENILEKYALIKSQIKDLETRAKLLQPEITRQIKEAKVEDNKLATNFGTFKIAERTTYVYSDELKATTAKMQEREIATGIAQKKTTEYLTFNN